MTVTFRGFPSCLCLNGWLPYFEQELLARGLIKQNIDIAQLIGMASKSALVHSTGGAFDIWQTDPQVSWVARKMGAMAWPRVGGAWEGNEHTHGVLMGCEHLHEQGKRQIRQGLLGKNGLISNLPDIPLLIKALVPGRGWKRGVRWHKRQVRIRKLRARRAEITATIQALIQKG